MDLEDIRQLLEGEGLVGAVEKASSVMPLDQLLVVLDLEAGRKLALQIAFLPDDDAEIESGRLLQFFVGLDEVAPSAAVRARIADLNRRIPLGAFHVHDELGAVYYRYVAMLPRGNVPAIAPVVVETVTLIEYILDSSFARIVVDDLAS
jgi:hypothetical protein